MKPVAVRGPGVLEAQLPSGWEFRDVGKTARHAVRATRPAPRRRSIVRSLRGCAAEVESDRCAQAGRSGGGNGRPMSANRRSRARGRTEQADVGDRRGGEGGEVVAVGDQVVTHHDGGVVARKVELGREFVGGRELAHSRRGNACARRRRRGGRPPSVASRARCPRRPRARRQAGATRPARVARSDAGDEQLGRDARRAAPCRCRAAGRDRRATPGPRRTNVDNRATLQRRPRAGGFESREAQRAAASRWRRRSTAGCASSLQPGRVPDRMSDDCGCRNWSAEGFDRWRAGARRVRRGRPRGSRR